MKEFLFLGDFLWSPVYPKYIIHTHTPHQRHTTSLSPLFSCTICIFFLVCLHTRFVVSRPLIIVPLAVNRWHTISKTGAIMAVVIEWIFTGWTRTSWCSRTRWPTWTDGMRSLPFSSLFLPFCLSLPCVCEQIEFSPLVFWYLGTSWSPRPERRPWL